MGIEGTRVLLVEDEAIIAMTVEDMLEALGCETVATAATLNEALAAAETASFDLALLDINLNGTESLPVAARLRALGLPFVFTTGYGPTGSGPEFADAPLVTKPYDMSDLAAAIAVALNQQP
ncbi:response regulator [Sphingomonas parva]|uniref:Response regulator n=1 Tax=Sphingomonas parva TaxID=2555898 RepID=A0A4Y8ZMP1_9SPHN|nr:response regulator [Sphingomonas parva]TFI56727.1 response regulator [Sphingomonas parva]